MLPFKGEAEGKEPEKLSEVCVAKEGGEEQSSREFQEVPVAAREFKSRLGNAVQIYRWRRPLLVTFA